MSAPVIEHDGVSALMRGSMEHTTCYAQETRYHQSVLHEAHGRQAAHGKDFGGPGGPAAERVAGMPRPAPVAVRSFSELVSRWDCWRGGSRDRPEGGGFLHLAIEIEGHLRRFEILFLYAIVFRLA